MLSGGFYESDAVEPRRKRDLRKEKDMAYGDDFTGQQTGEGPDEAPALKQDASGHTELPPAQKTIKNAWQTDVDKWFGLRKPTDDEAVTLDALRRCYLVQSKVLLHLCPANPDRTHAIRQLKESMQTAISSIVCSDTWDDIPGPKGD